MQDDGAEEGDVRALAQERLLDALLRALAIEQPSLLSTLRGILVDTEFTHPGKPEVGQSVHHQIRARLGAAAQFASDHGVAPLKGPAR